MTTLRVILCLLSLLASSAWAQKFDGAKAYIFEQSYVTRIPPAQAQTIARQPDLLERWRSYEWLKRHQERLPDGVQRQGKRLQFTAQKNLRLELSSYVSHGKRDSDDSQIFYYLQTLPEYHLLGVEFSHDEPHFLLIKRDNLRIYFIDSMTNEP